MIVPTQVEEAVVRTNALITIVLTALSVALQSPIPAAFLFVDFVIRGFLTPYWSPVVFVGRRIASVLPFERRTIYFPPKQFAARVGVLFSAAVTVLFVSGAATAATIVGGTLILFAFLECALNICVGCIVFSALQSMRQ